MFGCAAYANIPKDERKKLNVKAKKCALVGYGTEVKGYRLFDPLTQKVFYSRDVNKEQTGVEKEVRSEFERQIELELSDDVFSEPVDSDDLPEDGNSVPTCRSMRERRRPDYFIESVSVASAVESCTY